MSFSKVSEISVSYKTEVNISDMPVIKRSSDCEELFRSSFDENTVQLKEEMKAMLLNSGNSVLGIVNISSGSRAGTMCDPAILCAVALKGNAVGVVLCHNHPSGRLKPSEADIQITNRIQAGLSLFDIKLLDHIIIIPESGYFSFADQDMISDKNVKDVLSPINL